MARGTLSVCMIVRNEERTLADCLESVSGVADQLVVVDTGSTDDTAAVARSFGAQVHSFTWIDDFAAARNESIRHATGDWILWLDADEHLVSGSVEPLRQLLRPPKRPTIYQVWVHNLQADQQSYTMSMSHRLFSRHPQLRFSGRIHEQVHPSLKAAGGVEAPSDVVLEHRGYALSPEQMRVKLERNQALLEAMAAEQPDSSYAHYTLGQNYALLGDHEKALEASQRALDIGDFQGPSAATLLNALGEASWHLERLDQAETYARKSLAMTPRQSSGNFIMYRVMRSRGNVPGQINYLEQIVPLSQPGATRSDLPKDVLVPLKHLEYTLGELYLSIKEYASADKALRACLALEPESREARELLAASLAQQGCWEELLTTLDALPKPLLDTLREMVGVALIKLQRFEEAATHYRTWLDDHPDNEKVRKRLAGLYAKTGNREAAERLLRNSLP